MWIIINWISFPVEIQLSLVLGKLQPTKHAFVISQIELKHMIERVMPR